MSLTSSSTASDVKRGQNLKAEAGAEAKIITKKYQIMINNLHNI